MSSNIFVTVATAAPDQRAALAATLAPLQAMSVEAFLAEVAKVEEKAKAAKAARERKAKAEARNAAISALNAQAETVTVSLSDEEMETLEGILEGIGGLDDKGKALLVVSGISDGNLTFEVSGLKVRTAPTGGGRAKKDAPRPYVDRDGNRVIGWYTTFADNLSDADQDILDGDDPVERNDDGGYTSDNGKLVRRLVKHGFMVEAAL